MRGLKVLDYFKDGYVSECLVYVEILPQLHHLVKVERGTPCELQP